MRFAIIALFLIIAAAAAFASECGPVFYVVEGGRVIACQTCYGVTTCN